MRPYFFKFITEKITLVVTLFSPDFLIWDARDEHSAVMGKPAIKDAGLGIFVINTAAAIQVRTLPSLHIYTDTKTSVNAEECDGKP